MKGIDISNNNSTVDFQAVKNAGYEMVYIKSTEGLTYNDPLMRVFYEGAKSQGLKVGFYHFMRKNDPIQEVIHFLNSISGYFQDCIPMLDVEHDSLKDGSVVDRVRKFASYCKSQGVQVGLYTYTSFLKESMDGNTLSLPLWIAEYGLDKPHIDIDYVGFQYSEKGQVSGISTNCDLDEFTEGIFINGGEKDMKNIVCVNNSVDERAGNYLADFLGCSVINLCTTNAQIDHSKIENVYFVGGGEFPTITNSKIIKGNDRYDTMIEILKNIGKLK